MAAGDIGEIDVALDNKALPLDVLVRQSEMLFTQNFVNHGGVIGGADDFSPRDVARQMCGDFQGAKLDDIPCLDFIAVGVEGEAESERPRPVREVGIERFLSQIPALAAANLAAKHRVDKFDDLVV